MMKEDLTAGHDCEGRIDGRGDEAGTDSIARLLFT